MNFDIDDFEKNRDIKGNKQKQRVTRIIRGYWSGLRKQKWGNIKSSSMQSEG